MDERQKVRRSHRVEVVDRKRAEFTGITDVISFLPNKVLLESDYGHIVIKGDNLHVNRLTVEKGELSLDGRVDSIVYTDLGKSNQTSFFGKLLG